MPPMFTAADLESMAQQTDGCLVEYQGQQTYGTRDTRGVLELHDGDDALPVRDTEDVVRVATAIIDGSAVGQFARWSASVRRRMPITVGEQRRVIQDFYPVEDGAETAIVLGTP